MHLKFQKIEDGKKIQFFSGLQNSLCYWIHYTTYFTVIKKRKNMIFIFSSFETLSSFEIFLLSSLNNFLRKLNIKIRLNTNTILSSNRCFQLLAGVHKHTWKCVCAHVSMCVWACHCSRGHGRKASGLKANLEDNRNNMTTVGHPEFSKMMSKDDEAWRTFCKPWKSRKK